MIIGIGTDICALERIEKMLSGSKRELFLNKTYTPAEITAAPGAKAEVAYFAGRWAAKEAVAKALGTGFGANAPGSTLRSCACRVVHLNLSSVEKLL